MRDNWQLGVVPLVGVFLILWLAVISSDNQTGFPLIISRPQCGDERVVLMRVSQEGLTIAREPVDWRRLRGRLMDIYSTRAERVLYVEGEPNVSLQQVADSLDIAFHAVPNLRVVLVTASTPNRECLDVVVHDPL
jgi:biopolymer transport protein TolR